MAIAFLSFVMKLFLLPTERNNYFGSMSKYVLLVCRPKHRECVGRDVGGMGFLTFTESGPSMCPSSERLFAFPMHLNSHQYGVCL